MIKILVIDDDRMNCELSVRLHRHGYQVLSATSGIEGLTLFARPARHHS
jgi:CheY-like chemotaxis protein